MAEYGNLEQTYNKKYGSIDYKSIARKVIKQSINVGEAVVNILGATGIAGFKFHIPQTEAVKFESEITDQYTDINTPVQDHIALKPVTITLTGLVGDYFYSVNKIEDYIALITPTLALVSEFMNQENPIVKQIKSKWDNSKLVNGWNNFLNPAPQDLILDSSDANAYRLTLSGNALIEEQKTKFSFNSMDLFSLFQELYKLKSAQTRAFLYFEALWRARMLFSVETTWKRYDNMVIQSLEPKRDNNADITEFTITFKQIKTTSSRVESMEDYKNRRGQQAAAPIDKGETQGEKVSMLEGVKFA